MDHEYRETEKIVDNTRHVEAVMEEGGWQWGRVMEVGN
jgi:hypothetical protein